jgi:hypothetical protein
MGVQCAYKPKTAVSGAAGQYYKLLACSSTIEIEYPPSPLCDTCAAGGGVVQYLGPQLDMELQDMFWGGDRTLKVKLLVGRALVPEFPYLDVQWDRVVVNANFFNNIANALKLGGQVAGWLSGQINSVRVLRGV